MTPCIHGLSDYLFLFINHNADSRYYYVCLSRTGYRTASEYKVKHAQSDAPTATSIPNDTSRFNLGIGIDMTSGSADEAADRALNSVARKLDKSLSVESTVNELLAEATDPMNLATLFVGESFSGLSIGRVAIELVLVARLGAVFVAID